MWRTVWAEDGDRFYQDALAFPLDEIILRSYAGYGHVVPRMLATIGTYLPIEQFARWATFSAAILTSLLAIFVYFASAPLLRSRLRQSILAGAMILLPVLPYEALGSICTLHVMAPLACLLALLFPVDRSGAIAARLLVVVLGPLSSPICIIFAPLAIYHLVSMVRRRDVRRWRTTVIPAAFLLASIVQGVVYIYADHAPTPPMGPGTRARIVTELVPMRLGSNLVFGIRPGEWLWDAIGPWVGVVGLAVLGVLFVIKLRTSSTTSRFWILGIGAFSVGLYVFSLWQRPQYLSLMIPTAGEPFNISGLRYEVASQLLLVLALLVPPNLPRWVALRAPGAATAMSLGPDTTLRDAARQILGPAPWKALIAVCTIWVVVVLLPSYRLPTFRSDGPSWSSSVREARTACEVDGRVDSSVVEAPISPGAHWSVRFHCSQLD